MNATVNRPMIRAKDFFRLTGIPDSTRADWENPKSTRYDPSFPKKIRLGRRSVAYFLDEVMAWLESRRSE
ncbi:MAG: AlpA family phage regulatory protein [Agitococcus sp.]|jgi:prophage regulatory protein|nr:AlpA family phage regulatory protein [Agitococcus sp.]